MTASEGQWKLRVLDTELSLQVASVAREVCENGDVDQARIKSRYLHSDAMHN